MEDVTLYALIGTHHSSILFSNSCVTLISNDIYKKSTLPQGKYDKFREKNTKINWEQVFEGKVCVEYRKLFQTRIEEGVEKFILKQSPNYGIPARTLWRNKKALIKVKKILILQEVLSKPREEILLLTCPSQELVARLLEMQKSQFAAHQGG